MLVHSDSKPFSCSVCSETFKEQRNVVKHMKLKHFNTSTETQEKVVNHYIQEPLSDTYTANMEECREETPNNDSLEACPDSTESPE